MNKYVLYVFGGILFLIVGLSMYQANQSKNIPVDSGQGVDLSKSISPIPTNESDIETKNSLRYMPYSKAVFEQAANTRRVLFFYASWCPTCRPADASFSANQEKIPSDMTLIRVNYNDPDTDSDEKALAKKYTVTYQHTFVQIDNNGDKVAVWNGGQMAELLANSK